MTLVPTSLGEEDFPFLYRIFPLWLRGHCAAEGEKLNEERCFDSFSFISFCNAKIILGVELTADKNDKISE
mgnify:CR=1 FL=1